VPGVLRHAVKVFSPRTACSPGRAAPGVTEGMVGRDMAVGKPLTDGDHRRTVETVHECDGDLLAAAKRLNLNLDTLKGRVMRARAKGYIVNVVKRAAADDAFTKFSAGNCYEPTPAEIEQHCLAFQKTWKEWEFEQRGAFASSWTPPAPGSRFHEAIVEAKYAG
jgi:hypothetical protein